MRRPVLSVVLSAGTLLVLAIPALSMETGTGALSQFPEDHDVTVGVELLAEASGGGADPIRVVAELGEGASDPTEASAMAALRNDIAGDRAVSRVAEWQPSQDGQTVLLDVFPEERRRR